MKWAIIITFITIITRVKTTVIQTTISFDETFYIASWLSTRDLYHAINGTIEALAEVITEQKPDITIENDYQERLSRLVNKYHEKLLTENAFQNENYQLLNEIRNTIRSIRNNTIEPNLFNTNAANREIKRKLNSHCDILPIYFKTIKVAKANTTIYITLETQQEPINLTAIAIIITITSVITTISICTIYFRRKQDNIQSNKNDNNKNKTTQDYSDYVSMKNLTHIEPEPSKTPQQFHADFRNLMKFLKPIPPLYDHPPRAISIYGTTKTPYESCKSLNDTYELYEVTSR